MCPADRSDLSICARNRSSKRLTQRSNVCVVLGRNVIERKNLVDKLNLDYNIDRVGELGFSPTIVEVRHAKSEFRGGDCRDEALSIELSV